MNDANSLFEDEDDFVFVVEDVSEVDDLVGVVAHRQHRDLVQDVHRAVAQRAVGTRPADLEYYHQMAKYWSFLALLVKVQR